MVFPTFFSWSLNLAIRSLWSEPQPSLSCFCWLYRASPPLATKNLILVLTIWWYQCVEPSLVLLEEGVCYDLNTGRSQFIFLLQSQEVGVSVVSTIQMIKLRHAMGKSVVQYMASKWQSWNSNPFSRAPDWSGVCLVTQPCQTLCDPLDYSLAPLSMRFSRQEHWSEFQFPPPGDLLDIGIKPTSSVSPTLQANILPTEPSGLLIIVICYLHHLWGVCCPVLCLASQDCPTILCTLQQLTVYTFLLSFI